MRWGVFASAALHLAAVMLLVVWMLLFGGRAPPPEAVDPPGFDVVMGEAAAEKGEAATESPAVENPPPAPEPTTEPVPDPPADPVPPAPPAVRLGTIDPGFTSIDDPNKIATPATLQNGNQPPVYPREAERRRLQGTVVLRVQIGADGRATQVDVIESSGHKLLDDAAQARLMIWAYRPGKRHDGTAAPDIIEIGINFQLH